MKDIYDDILDVLCVVQKHYNAFSKLARIYKYSKKPSVNTDLLLFPITNALKYQSTNLIINSILGPKYVALLSIYLTLARIIVNLTSITDGIIKIELAKLWVSKQLDNLKKIFIFNIQIALFSSVIIIVLLAFFNQLILRLSQKSY